MTPRNDIYKEWVESHPRTVRALTLAPASAPSAMRATPPKGESKSTLTYCFYWCPGEDSNLHGKSYSNQSLNAVRLFELPRKLPTPIARCGGTAWHPVSSPEHAP